MTDQIRPETVYADEGGASRFFYAAKSSKSERNLGLPPDFSEQTVDDGRTVTNDTAYQRGATLRKNPHPTVKPIDLMRYLIRLVTPPGGVVLDPFAGSGTTLIAAFQEKFQCIGIEQSEEYCDLISQRLNGVIAMTAPTLF